MDEFTRRREWYLFGSRRFVSSISQYPAANASQSGVLREPFGNADVLGHPVFAQATRDLVAGALHLAEHRRGLCWANPVSLRRIYRLASSRAVGATGADGAGK
jgi:hypothetical protein